MKIKNKYLYFIIILVLTIIIIRVITLYLIDPDIIIKGFELHHFYYGIILLIIATLILIFKREKLIVYLTLYTISLGLIIDELEYALRGFGGTEKYAATFPSVIILTFISILVIKYLKYKNESNSRPS